MKEKIIDGVDVAGCKHYDDICYEEDRFPLSCKGNDCMFKQLKRLEQENEVLKKQLEIDKNQINYFIEENEKLKTRLRPLEDSYFNGLSSIEIAELAKKSIKITFYNRKLETALEEISEMLPESKCKYACFSCPESGQCKEEWAKPIKRIVTEAIGE